MQVYNDADILEKILKDKRKEMGPFPEEEDLVSPKLKLSKFDCVTVFPSFGPLKIRWSLL